MTIGVLFYSTVIKIVYPKYNPVTVHGHNKFTDKRENPVHPLSVSSYRITTWQCSQVKVNDDN